MVAVEKYRGSDEALRPEAARAVFSNFADQENPGSANTVTISGELSDRLKAKLALGEFKPDFFDEMETEVMILISANGLHDYLKQFQAPNLEECFVTKEHFDNFYEFARERHQEHLVDLVRLIILFQSDMREGSKSQEEKEKAALALLEYGKGCVSKEAYAATLEAIRLHKVDPSTFDICKNEALKLIMGDLFPEFAAFYVRGVHNDV